MARQILVMALEPASYMALLAPSEDPVPLGLQDPGQAGEASPEVAWRGSWAAQG